MTSVIDRDRTSGEVVPSGRRKLLLESLRASGSPRSIVSLAEELGVHANTVRFHLESLQRTGFVEQLLADPEGPGRPPILFRATRQMDPEGPSDYRLLAGMLTSHLAASSPDPAGVATELGRSWGPRLVGTTRPQKNSRSGVTRGVALAHLTGALSDLGFAPEPLRGPRDTTIRLRHCPFLSLVTRTGVVSKDPEEVGTGYGDVICALHLGLMQGALASLRAPVTVEQLDPFVEPDLCVAHVALVGGRARLASRGYTDE